MAAAGLRPHPDDEPAPVGRFLTFVVPAPGGCNLKCSFCLIRQRREITETHLRPNDLVRFIREAAERSPIYALAIQGYEPLLPASLPYTQAIVATGRLLGIQTSLVTNGVLLSDTLGLMAVLAPSKIAVSLDASLADVHDRIRDVAGSWAAAVNGMTRAVETLTPRTRLVASSVLLPGKRHYLDGMPALLRNIGVDRWIVNPLLRVGRDDVGGLVADRTSLFRDLLLLQEAAGRAAVRLTVDDEFGRLGHGRAGDGQIALRSLPVRALPPNIDIFRLVPSGRCSMGEDILKQVTSKVPRWRPGGVHAGDFLHMLSSTSA